ncbi:hypothetical protein LCGC14_1315770 [marine sediment metagenome]|uniref:Uncharacterized protein n=1 Tax=marine sediment metagenome TaxID=412755 RepID=A0A0F9N1Z0_9ZZZZ
MKIKDIPKDLVGFIFYIDLKRLEKFSSEKKKKIDTKIFNLGYVQAIKCPMGARSGVIIEVERYRKDIEEKTLKEIRKEIVSVIK